MAWSRGPGSEKFFLQVFGRKMTNFGVATNFKTRSSSVLVKQSAKTSSAVCLEFAETLFFNPFFETAGALEFLSATPIFALLWHPQTSSHLFLAFFGVLNAVRW